MIYNSDLPPPTPCRFKRLLGLSGNSATLKRCHKQAQSKSYYVELGDGNELSSNLV